MFLNKNTGKIWVLIGFEPTKQHVINTSQQRKKIHCAGMRESDLVQIMIRPRVFQNARLKEEQDLGI